MFVLNKNAKELLLQFVSSLGKRIASVPGLTDAWSADTFRSLLLLVSIETLLCMVVVTKVI